MELLRPVAALPPLFDANAAVGDWPFRRLPCNTIERLLARMDALGIRRAAVSRLENVLYKDCLAGNRELVGLLAPHRDRFVPLFTVNPAFPGWEEDLELCVQDLGLAAGRAGLRLYPSYHQYPLDGPDAAAFLARAAQLDVPVAVSARLEDERTQHWLAKVPAVSAEVLTAAIAAYQDVRWLICGLRATQIRAVWRSLDAQGAAGARILFDLSLVQGPIDECRLLAEAVGAERLAFATGLPLTIAEAPALALAYAGLAPDATAQIASGSAAALFQLES